MCGGVFPIMGHPPGSSTVFCASWAPYSLSSHLLPSVCFSQFVFFLFLPPQMMGKNKTPFKLNMCFPPYSRTHSSFLIPHSSIHLLEAALCILGVAHIIIDMGHRSESCGSPCGAAAEWSGGGSEGKGCMLLEGGGGLTWTCCCAWRRHRFPPKNDLIHCNIFLISLHGILYVFNCFRPNKKDRMTQWSSLVPPSSLTASSTRYSWAWSPRICSQPVWCAGAGMLCPVTTSFGRNSSTDTTMCRGSSTATQVRPRALHLNP